MTKTFTIEQVRKLNSQMQQSRQADLSNLPSAAAKAVRESKFTREDINRAYSQAYKKLQGE